MSFKNGLRMLFFYGSPYDAQFWLSCKKQMSFFLYKTDALEDKKLLKNNIIKIWTQYFNILMFGQIMKIKWFLAIISMSIPNLFWLMTQKCIDEVEYKGLD